MHFIQTSTFRNGISGENEWHIFEMGSSQALVSDVREGVLLYVWPGRSSPGPHSHLLGRLLLVGGISDSYDGNMENCTEMLHLL